MAFHVRSVVVFAFALFCKVSFPKVHILTCSDLYMFWCYYFRIIVSVFKYLDPHSLKTTPFGVVFVTRYSPF